MPTQNGTPGNDTLNGSGSADILNGLGGDDILNGLDGNDELNGGDDNDTLNGGIGEDELHGGDGNDILDGGATVAGISTPAEDLYGEGGDDILGERFNAGSFGSQNMYGGTGNDTFYLSEDGTSQVAGFFWPADRVFENAGEGFDTVYVSFHKSGTGTIFNYTLAAGQEIEALALDPMLAATKRANFTGNEFANLLYGGALADTLRGMDGDDYLIGGAGADTMEGGAGSDTYYVDNVGDVIVEPVAVGNDRVATSISYALGADADIELFEAVNSTDTVAMDLTGNGFGQTIVGNAGVNHIDAGGGADLIDGLGGADVLAGGAGDDYLIGGTGADSMDGGAGSDIFYVDNASDVVIDAVAPGNDRVAASVSYTLTADADIEQFEAITLSATDALDFTGNGFGQTIVGNNGVNVIDGKGGADILAGLGGADTFAFSSALGGSNVDTIADFSAADDTIALDDAVFTGLAPGALPAGAFVTGGAAGDADDRIVYDSATGALYFDADGSGAGAMVQFATLAGAPAITASDFTVI